MSAREADAGGVFSTRIHAAVIAIALLFVTWQAVENASRFRTYFSSSEQAHNVGDEMVFGCIEDLFQQEVPAKSRVWVEEADAMWQQRLAEFSVPWAQLAAERRDADLVVSMGSVVDPTAPNCFGLTVVVDRA